MQRRHEYTCRDYAALESFCKKKGKYFKATWEQLNIITCISKISSSSDDFFSFSVTMLFIQ